MTKITNDELVEKGVLKEFNEALTRSVELLGLAAKEVAKLGDANKKAFSGKEIPKTTEQIEKFNKKETETA